MVGRSQLAAPISSAGVVLSQPTSSTTPSIGLPRIDSSTSMLARLRNSMAVGRRLRSRRATSPGIRAGSRRPRSTPRFTCSAISRKCALQGVSSDQVLQMPMTGRPSKRSAGRPWFFIQLRCIIELRPVPPNQACERSFRPLLLMRLGVPFVGVFCSADLERARAHPLAHCRSAGSSPTRAASGSRRRMASRPARGAAASGAARAASRATGTGSGSAPYR